MGTPRSALGRSQVEAERDDPWHRIAEERLRDGSRAIQYIYGRNQATGYGSGDKGHVEVSHLSASFGLPEIVSQVTQYLGDGLPASFDQAWLDYCYYYGAGAVEQDDALRDVVRKLESPPGTLAIDSVRSEEAGKRDAGREGMG